MSHNLFVYDTDAAFAERVAAFLADGLAAGEAVLAVVPAPKRDLLADALGPGAEAIDVSDSHRFYLRPESALASYDTAVRQVLRHGPERVRVVGELPVFDAPEQQRAFGAYEAILNRAFARLPMRLMCTYDARVQPARVIDAAVRTHPRLVTAGGSESNPACEDPADVVTDLQPAPAPLALRDLDLDGGVIGIRRRLAAELRAARVADVLALDLMLAVAELLDNAAQHGGGIRAVRVGRHRGSFVCEVADHGPGISDPMAGFLPPDPEVDPRCGLWSARQLTRRLEVVDDGSRAAVRVWV